MAEAELPDEAQLGLRLPESSRPQRPVGFDLETWAAAARFDIPERAASFVQRVESAAEAYVVRELFNIPGVLYDGGDRVYYHGAAIRLQVPAGVYRLDLVVEFEQIRLDVEIDGLEHHGLTQAQFARDYYRARRLMIGGFVVVRFTASEAMTQPRQCWRDVFGILKTRSSIERRA
jgi:very-short-patch-repair endonuclease